MASTGLIIFLIVFFVIVIIGVIIVWIIYAHDHTKVSCTTNTDCKKPGETCQAGKCRSGTGGCTINTDCPAGQICIHSICTDIQCTMNSECPTSMMCQNNNCVPVVGTGCKMNSQCKPGQQCINNKCVSPGPTGAMCSTSSQCPIGTICIGATGPKMGSCQIPVPPTIISTPNPVVPVGSNFVYIPIAAGSTVTRTVWSGLSTAPWLRVGPVYEISGTPVPGDVGIYNGVSVTVYNAAGQSANQRLFLNVVAEPAYTNEIVSSPYNILKQGDLYTYTLVFDGIINSITFACSGTCQAELQIQGAQVFGYLTDNSTIIATVIDNNGNTHIQTWNVMVVDSSFPALTFLPGQYGGYTTFIANSAVKLGGKIYQQCTGFPGVGISCAQCNQTEGSVSCDGFTGGCGRYVLDNDGTGTNLVYRNAFDQTSIGWLTINYTKLTGATVSALTNIQGAYCCNSSNTSMCSSFPTSVGPILKIATGTGSTNNAPGVTTWNQLQFQVGGIPTFFTYYMGCIVTGLTNMVGYNPVTDYVVMIITPNGSSATITAYKAKL